MKPNLEILSRLLTTVLTFLATVWQSNKVKFLSWVALQCLYCWAVLRKFLSKFLIMSLNIQILGLNMSEVPNQVLLVFAGSWKATILSGIRIERC